MVPTFLHGGVHEVLDYLCRPGRRAHRIDVLSSTLRPRSASGRPLSARSRGASKLFGSSDNRCRPRPQSSPLHRVLISRLSGIGPIYSGSSFSPLSAIAK
jgi:hypothetical protein